MKQYYALAALFFLCFASPQDVLGQNKLSDSGYGSLIEHYLQNNKTTLGLTDRDIADLYVTNEVFSKKSNLTHVYTVQRHQGIEVFNAISNFAIKNGKVFHFANNFVSNAQQKINTITPIVTAETAVQKASLHFGLGSPQGLEILTSDERKIEFNGAGISNSNIPVQLVFFYDQENDKLSLAWDLNIDQKDGKHWWSVRVDALTGLVIDKNDWVVSCNFGLNHQSHSHGTTGQNTLFDVQPNMAMAADGSQYNVFPIPFESPNHGPRSILSQPADSNASPYGWHDTNGANGAEYTITRGNNVWAQEDVDGNNNTSGYSPDGTAALNFDFPLNLYQVPSENMDAAITNLFYMNNVMHDVWYQYGFDEASGNFQQNNYGNGGLGNDYVIAQSQDGSGTNNANFSSPPDGSSPRMQMYLWGPFGVPQPLTINNGPLAGSYTAALPATGTGNNITPPGSVPVTADLALVNDGSSAPTEACNSLVNGSSVNGKIAVIKRGNCNFVDKIQNAQNAGAVAVIMVNHNNPTNDPTYTEYVNMAGSSNPPFTIPSIFVNYANGQPIIDALTAGQTINATIVNNGPFQIDASFDNGIIAHEYGHGITNRLTGGAANASCLSNREQMGEGWSDWFALMLTMKTGDQPEDPRGIATFSVGESTNGLGIRPAYYTTDFSINNYTYGATNNNTVIGEIDGVPVRWNDIPHNIGFVWATILWDLTWAYVDKYGFDPDMYYGTGGNNRAMHVVTEALKLQPCGPGFVSGRDAILAADTALYGGVDQCLIWEVFANRGVGTGASQGFAFSITDQVESFTMPDENDPSLANCTSLGMGEFNIDEIKIYPNPTNGMLKIKTNRNMGEVTISLTDINGRQILSNHLELFNETELDLTQLQTGIYILNIQGANFDFNKKIIKN